MDSDSGKNNSKKNKRELRVKDLRIKAARGRVLPISFVVCYIFIRFANTISASAATEWTGEQTDAVGEPADWSVGCGGGVGWAGPSPVDM